MNEIRIIMYNTKKYNNNNTDSKKKKKKILNIIKIKMMTAIIQLI